MEKPRMFLLDEALADEVVDYLSRRPYIEVYHLISRISQLRVIALDKLMEQGKPSPAACGSCEKTDESPPAADESKEPESTE